jgi:hypothetical protein
MRIIGLLVSMLVVVFVVGWIVSFGSKDALSFSNDGCAHAQSTRPPKGCQLAVRAVASRNQRTLGASPR